MVGTVTKVTVTFHNLTHTTANDIDAMVVAPDGRNLVVMSDATSVGTGTTVTNATLTFDDDAPNALPLTGAIATGPYKPTNRSIGDPDAFPRPAPSPSNATTLGVFTGMASANGTWSLYVVDDGDGDIGSMAGGWSLTITTATAAVATATALTSSDANSTTGQTVTFTATVRTGAGAPVTEGTVRFEDESTGTSLGSATPNSSGVATVNVSNLAEGSHLIRATYSGTGFLGSFASLTQRVDNVTEVNGNTFCNAGGIALPATGTTPYPSNIFVTGLSGEITKVTASLRGVTHPEAIDLDVLLSGPTPTQNIVLLSDAGLVPNTTTSGVTNANLVFDDSADGPVPSPIVSGIYRPTDLDPENPVDPFPSAPTQSGATLLSTFNGGGANGTWSLWVVDDDPVSAVGSISGGWCLTITAQDPTETALTASPNPSTFGQQVTFTATVTDADDDPVTAGTVQFRDGATNLGSPVAVGADGTATFTTPTPLSVGSHEITAAYGGTTDLAESSGTVTQVVSRAQSRTELSSSVNPSDVGELVTFTATVTSGGSPLTTGSVQFIIGGDPAGATVPLPASGQVTLTTGALPAGTHVIQARYTGTTEYIPSEDDLNQVVEKLATQTDLTSSSNPSDFGETVTFTATVTSGGALVSGGSVQFRDDGAALGGPVPVAADGTATWTTATLDVGSHPITAEYMGTAELDDSTSVELDQVVGQAAS
ncbi:MAG TPA: Ig-like domain-containing protein, partial [Microlunatus sp.]